MTNSDKVIKGLEELSSFLFQAYGKVQAEEANLFYERFLAVDNALELLKEQETVNWIKCTDKLPNVDGYYLVVKSIMGRYNKIDVCAFTLNLHDKDEFDFPDEKRPGWYEHDSETGYFEWTGITHWATLPQLPDSSIATETGQVT